MEVRSAWLADMLWFGRKQKQLGAWNFMQIDEGLEAFTLRLFTKVLGWDVQEVQVLLAMVRKDLKNRRVHAQFD